jgi:hypothetical protein
MDQMNLTVLLALLGAGVLVALGLHGWWSARRAGPRRAEAAPSVAPGGDRVEPTLGGASGAPLAQDPPMLRVPAARRAARLDALIDVIVPMTLEAPVTGEMAVAHLPASRRAGTKPMHVEGLDTETGDWDLPTHGRSYSEFQAGVQLANRSGALNEIEYSEFVQKVQTFAEGVNAMPDFPDMLDVVARARELDTFASPLDAQLALVLRANSVAWSVGYLQQCAGRHGFVPGALPGRLVLPGSEEGAPPVLVLSFDAQAALADDPQDPQAAVREVTLSLDVPQTAESAEPFPTWHRLVTQLADDMDATPVDDQGTPVTLHAYDAIGRELVTLYRTLESRDLPAGSAAARRLFS